ncbi:MAG: OsmC family protein [Anaerolineaceae bacterium]|nr:OsmC family protein [Anaerolineaceae bacterium]MBN2677042.1 OsmC family protein [Anaerolineaceae bacterium]
MTPTRNRVDLDKAQHAYEAGRERRLRTGGKVTLRATAKLVKNTFLEGRIGKYHFTCDEPPERGGDDEAASPLEYFLTGAAFCLLSQVVQFAPLYAVEIEDADVDLRVEFDDAEKHGLPGPGAAFTNVVFKVKIKSPSPADQVQKLLMHAERGCHTAQSLRAAVPVTVETEIITPE